ncbi:MAG: hypothetical protein RDV48_07730 [Candidatus Eremiobacteraeota bacterium]|nr:hypothetical protein [Candidatus Eremiobacteraeota bacterium]
MIKRGTTLLGILMVLALFSAGRAWAQLPDSLKKKLHSQKECGVFVVMDRNVADISRLAREPAMAKILVIQVMPEKMTAELGDVLMKWVRDEGGTVWFYDSRLAKYFGMEELPITAAAMSKKMDGEYGGRKHPGIAILGQPFGEHPVLSGVTGAVVFVMKVSEGNYSAVNSGGAVKALLKTELIKPAAISAIREEGKGRVILKPLLWPDQVDGARFQANLLEYSAGFPIPRITDEQSRITDELLVEKKEGAALKEVDVLVLADGRTVWGKVLEGDITMEAPDKSVKCLVGDISSIEIGEASGLDTMITKKDKKLKGFLSLKGGLQFMTPSGAKVLLEKKEIKKILFNRSKEEQGRGRIDTPDNSGGTR